MIRNLAGWLILLVLAPGAAGNVAIRNATVHTGVEAESTIATIVVSGSRIVAVGADVEVPPDAEIIDARNQVITPGLFHSYTQLGIRELGLEASTVDSTVAEFVMGPAFAVASAINPRSVHIPVARGAGIVHAVVAPTSGNDVFAGRAAVIRLDAGAAALVLDDAALFASLGAAASTFSGGSRAAALLRIERGFAEAARYSGSRYRADPTAYGRHDLAALRSFLDADQPLVVSANRASDIRQALALADRIDKRLVVLGAAEGWQVAEALAAANATVAINPYANLPSSFDTLGSRLDNAALLDQAGARVVFATSRPERLRYSAGLAVANGMSWASALAAVTRVPAETWGVAGTGTLVSGQRADLVIWDGDPFEVTTAAQRVMIGGEWQSLESRQTRLLQRYRVIDSEQPAGFR